MWDFSSLLSQGLSDYRMPGMSRMAPREEMPGIEETEIPQGEGWKGLAKQGLGMFPAGSAIGIVSTIAGMIGRKKAEEEAEERREKEEALRRASWMSQRREQAVGRWS